MKVENNKEKKALESKRQIKKLIANNSLLSIKNKSLKKINALQASNEKRLSKNTKTTATHHKADILAKAKKVANLLKGATALEKELKTGKTRNKKLQTKGNNAAKVAIRKLDKKDKEIERLRQELKTYTFISSHDLQEPLRHLQVIASVLKEKEASNLSPQGKDYLERMQKAAKRIQSLIHDLIEYTNTNNTLLTPERTDLNRILTDIKKEFSDTIKEQGISIRSTKLDTLNIIPFQFRKLFKEIIGNSIKFSPIGKKLKIDVASEIIKGSKLKNTLLPARKEFCHLYFKDNGIGFDPKFNDRIFEVFQKLQGKDQPGSGIGLATCKKIVENYAGKISAEGMPGVGATVDIYIPLEKGKKPR